MSVVVSLESKVVSSGAQLTMRANGVDMAERLFTTKELNAAWRDSVDAWIRVRIAEITDFAYYLHAIDAESLPEDA